MKCALWIPRLNPLFFVTLLLLSIAVPQKALPQEAEPNNSLSTLRIEAKSWRVENQNIYVCDNGYYISYRAYCMDGSHVRDEYLLQDLIKRDYGRDALVVKNNRDELPRGRSVYTKTGDVTLIRVGRLTIKVAHKEIPTFVEVSPYRNNLPNLTRKPQSTTSVPGL